MKVAPTVSVLVLWCLLNVSLAVASPQVWFDEAHAQAFKVGQSGELQLSGLAKVFREGGWEVVPGTEPLTARRLKQVQALVISGPFKPLAASEVEAVLKFIRDGGRVAVMLHIGPPLSSLLSRLGVLHSNGVIQEQANMIEGEALNFHAQLGERHPVTSGIEHFALYGSWALLAEEAQTETLASSSSRSWVDLNGNRQLDEDDAQQSFAVLVHGKLGRGEYLVFGDDAIFQNRFLRDENLTLASNLATWLMAGPQGELAVVTAGKRDE